MKTEPSTALFVARGRSLAIAEAHYAKAQAHTDLALQIQKELGANATYTQGGACSGWSFAAGVVPPVALNAALKFPKRGRDMHIGSPNPKTPEGQALLDRLAQAPPARSHELVGALLPDCRHVGFGGLIGNGIDSQGRLVSRGVGLERLAGGIVIEVPIPDGETAAPVPLDATPLPRSEYWAWKEALATEKAKAKAPVPVSP